MQGNRAKTLLRAASVTSGLLMTGAAAWAQVGDTALPRQRLGLFEGIYTTLLFGIIGILLAVIGFKLFDIAVRHNIETEIFEHKNMAAALLAGAVVLGVSLIVAATILS